MTYIDPTQRELQKIADIRKELSNLYGNLRFYRGFGHLPEETKKIDFDVLARAMNVIEDYEQLVKRDHETVLNILAGDRLADDELSPVAKREAGLVDALLSYSVLGGK